MNPCDNEADRKKLFDLIQSEFPEYSPQNINDSIDSCCSMNKEYSAMVSCVKELARTKHLMTFKPN